MRLAKSDGKIEIKILKKKTTRKHIEQDVIYLQIFFEKVARHDDSLVVATVNFISDSDDGIAKNHRQGF